MNCRHRQPLPNPALPHPCARLSEAALGVRDPKHKHDFVFSILRIFDPSAPTTEVNAAESHFKAALLTRQFGLNRN